MLQLENKRTKNHFKVNHASADRGFMFIFVSTVYFFFQFLGYVDLMQKKQQNFFIQSSIHFLFVLPFVVYIVPKILANCRK